MRLTDLGAACGVQSHWSAWRPGWALGRWQVLQQVTERGKFMGMTIDGPHGRQARSYHWVPDLSVTVITP